MELARYVEALEADLAGIAAVGDDATAEAARRLSAAIRASAGLRLLDALGEAALELNEQLGSGRVEVRLAGQDPSLIYVEEGAPAPAPEGQDRGPVPLPPQLPPTIIETRRACSQSRDGSSPFRSRRAEE